MVSNGNQFYGQKWETIGNYFLIANRTIVNDTVCSVKAIVRLANEKIIARLSIEKQLHSQKWETIDNRFTIAKGTIVFPLLTVQLFSIANGIIVFSLLTKQLSIIRLAMRSQLYGQQCGSYCKVGNEKIIVRLEMGNYWQFFSHC